MVLRWKIKIKKSQELKFGVAASALRLLLAPDKRLSNNQKGYSPKRPWGGEVSISKIVINLAVTVPPIHTHTCTLPPPPPNTHIHSLVSSPGPTPKIGKGAWLHFQTSRMCWLSISCNNCMPYTIMWQPATVDNGITEYEQILLWSDYGQILWGESSSLANVNTLSKFQVFENSVSLVFIFKWSWNESTIFTCQEFSDL